MKLVRKPLLTNEEREEIASGLVALAKNRGRNLQVAARMNRIPRQLAISLLMACFSDYSAALGKKVESDEVAFLWPLMTKRRGRAERELARILKAELQAERLIPVYTGIDAYVGSFIPIHAIIAAETE